jgi:NTP pyrophosphatase (non-canonical NTP hydrolase)
MERTLLRTYQELGELTDAIMKEKAQADIEDELADVLAWVISIANLLDMELGLALLKKYSNACSKCGSLPCESADTR